MRAQMLKVLASRISFWAIMAVNSSVPNARHAFATKCAPPVVMKRHVQSASVHDVRIVRAKQVDEVMAGIGGVTEFAPRHGDEIRRQRDVQLTVSTVRERAMINPDMAGQAHCDAVAFAEIGRVGEV